MEKKIRISCLPVAGIQNPSQFLMIKGLQSDPRLLVKNGIDDRFWGILKTAIKQNPDYIHFEWETSYYYRRSLWMTFINIPIFMLQVYLVRYFFNCKLVWTPHNLVPHNSKYIKVHRFCRHFFARNMTWIRLFSLISLPAFIDELKCDKKKFRIIQEGSLVEYYPNHAGKTESRDHLKIDQDKLVLLYLGFIKPYKGISELIEYFNESFTDNAILLIAGKVMDQGYFQTIEKAIKGNKNIVVVDRFIKEDELQYFFNAADVVTLPFKKIENSGSVVLSMSFKKPVIAPKMGVLIDRLINQPELLYTESLEDSFKVLTHLTQEDLKRIGEKNFHELSKYKWSDFAAAF
ncbi:MAG: glycosyltransferase [Ginsengibacter sp.]